jgi:DNA replication and repair protein RecF
VGGLAIKALQLSQFRSHTRTQLVFDGRPVAISGPNGAGKTNILEAISLLSPGRGLRRAGADELARRAGGVGWKVAADVAGLGADHQIEIWAEQGSARAVRIDSKAATQTALGRILRVLWLVPAMDRLWLDAAEARRRFLDRMALSLMPDHAEAVLAYEKAMRERNRLLKDQVHDQHWYSALEAQMAQHGAQIRDNRAQALAQIAAAQTARGPFPVADLAIVGDDAQDLWHALAAGRGRDLAAGRSLIGPHRADLQAVYAAKSVPADQCSTGEQKALLISLILANARAIAQDTGAAPILLLDEVAAHLDPNRRAALYDEICALGAQALMTGTEASLFDSLGARAQNIHVTEADGQSHIMKA